LAGSSHKGFVAVSFSTPASLIEHALSAGAQKFKIRSIRLLNEQKIPHAQMLESTLRRGLNRASRIFQIRSTKPLKARKAPHGQMLA
jgi:hypothetical protein